ncbi:MAG: hypothetical protein ACOCXO_06275 [Bacteroidota bacterium]
MQKIPRQVGSRQPALCCSYFPEAACKRPEEALQAGIQEKLQHRAATGCTPSLPIDRQAGAQNPIKTKTGRIFISLPWHYFCHKINRVVLQL